MAQVPLRTIRGMRRVLHGNLSGTPSPSVLRFTDVGLLYFLNQKQSQLHEAAATLHEEDLPTAIQNLINFMRVAVSGLIVEAERVDAAVIAVRKQVVQISTELRHRDAELQHRRPHLGSIVDQAIAQHYQTKLLVPQRQMPSRPRLESLSVSENQQLGELPTSIVSLRAQLAHVKSHLKVVVAVQRLIHGSGQRIPEAEAAAVIAELDIVCTLRKAAHKIRDTLLDVPNRDDILAVASVLDYIDMACSGLIASADEVAQLEHAKSKALAASRSTRVLQVLDRRDSDNKTLSAEARHMNEASYAGAAAPISWRNPSASAVEQPSRAASRGGSVLDDFLAAHCA